MQIESTSSKPWRWKLFFSWFLVLALLSASYLIPSARSFWQQLDEQGFFFLNSWIETSPTWQAFWAIANHPIADWIEDLVFIVFFFFYIKTGKGSEEKIKRVAHLLVLALTLALVIKFINQGFFRYVVYFGRESPSITMEPVTLLSKHIDWIKVKCRSHSSFPSDHATTALLFTGYYCMLSEKSLHRTLAVLYGLFLCLPRLIIGAHWLTDILLGSSVIVVLALGFLFLTPLHSRLEHLFVSLLSLKNKWKRA